MIYFRKFLTWLRKNYNLRARKYLLLWGLVFLVTGAAAVLVDIFVPFGSGWNLIRTAVLIPLGVSIFALGYATSLTLHYVKRMDPAWVPYRSRFSPMWRLRIAAIVGAAMLLLVYAVNESPIFTLFSSSVAAGVLALVAFVRQTNHEMKRANLGIPDARDVEYDSKVQAAQQRRKNAIEAKEAEKIAKAEAKGKRKGRLFRPIVSETSED